jgi:hypothetical protein
MVPSRLLPRALQVLAICATAALVVTSQDRAAAPTAPLTSPFAARIVALSESGGYFDTDNLISNERSYLQVLPELGKRTPQGGAYIGVGPDTNFSYIAAVRPAVAFIVDVRRDNLLLHLLFKALFTLSDSRAGYLANLLGRPVPPKPASWDAASIERIIAFVDSNPADAPGRAALKRRRDETIRKTGLPLSSEDLETIDRFHQRFIEEGLELRFQSTGRAPQYHYPTYRELLLETDAAGRQANYLASEAAFRAVQALHARDLIIPVVGDLGGPTALLAVGRLLASRGERLSAFYTSNVEFYLFGQGRHAKFLANLRQLPHVPDAVLIRSVFGRYSAGGRPGDGSTSHLERVDRLLRDADHGRVATYGQLVAR